MTPMLHQRVEALQESRRCLASSEESLMRSAPIVEGQPRMIQDRGQYEIV